MSIIQIDDPIRKIKSTFEASVLESFDTIGVRINL